MNNPVREAPKFIYKVRYLAEFGYREYMKVPVIEGGAM